ncbi:DOUBLE-STRAND BREAK DNA REPAIR PROTEIN (RAD32 HOMOLOG) [Encephalitozoon cuniculi GB-M1]|uniref:Double-strand break repair protein MRE11 n=1 Tax=Encephalitozoon cuniculi (strain GB-M1) TaxID=284813 RepID=MRE11_ENCCU|nr:uncharacterized protein ECU05_1280 [Encephalitozoon cuniculi GB-M1]Q8SRV0.1 RecName: Full=Double-strand break repair protein MRE11 [Encephalitozoon cuniculi GB-M1]CAD26648.1 DOUBLE-STRAND BREAK DNA REPAIR PROTEIN (RAD32 HOMOLOG) [Encephalitozoon cuniculi GB-M1]
MKILITSDNHLGYRESDPVLLDDSYDTFEEILGIAQRERVDLVLQGGDLFHENRPSRSCLNRTIGLFRRYCIGNERSGLRSNLALNFHDQNIGISIPVVSIHGNHDDPSGISMVSPIDILQSAGLVNYIGKYNLIDRIDVYPLLLEKEYRVAIYGLGHIKDRRLYRMFCEGRIVFHRPEDYDSWYNVLILHQNRIPREKEHFSSDLVEGFFDLIVYGHEHESMVVKGDCLILQPGSTVRTSLCEGERHDKYAYILRIGEECTLEHVKLRSVRPLLLDTLRIEERDNVEEKVENKIRGMIDLGRKKESLFNKEITAIDVDTKRFKCRGDSNEACGAGPVCKGYQLEEKTRIPLVKLKIELCGDEVLDKHRFSAQFKGLVANPSDMLTISRKTRRREEVETQPMAERVEISQILRKILGNVEFGVLSRLGFSESLDEFVKGDSNAFMGMVRKNIEKVVNAVDHSSIVDEDVIKAMKRASREEDRGYEEDHFEPRAALGVLDEMDPGLANKNLRNEYSSRLGGNSEENESKAKKNFNVEDLLGKEYLSKKLRKDKEDSSTDVSFTFSKYL